MVNQSLIFFGTAIIIIFGYHGLVLKKSFLSYVVEEISKQMIMLELVFGIIIGVFFMILGMLF